MDENTVLKLLKTSAGGRKTIGTERGVCAVCDEEYWMVFLEDGAVLTFHGDEHGMPEHDGCFDELQKMTKEFREATMD